MSADVPFIETLIAAAFTDAQHTSHTEQFIVSALRKSGSLTLSLVAEVNDEIVGHVAISPVSISDGCRGWYGLGPISVLPNYQGQGIGSQLMKQAIAELKKLQVSGCVLVGDPKYYERFGFKVEPLLVLPDVPPEYFQAVSFTDEVPQGTVTYHESFNAQD